MSSIKNASLYADLPSFPSPSLITGDSPRPDLVLGLNNTTVYLLELTVGFESNIKVNSDRKAAKYHLYLTSLRIEYTTISFVKFSVSALGTTRVILLSRGFRSASGYLGSVRCFAIVRRFIL